MKNQKEISLDQIKLRFPSFAVQHLLKDLRKRRDRFLKGKKVQRSRKGLTWGRCLERNLRKLRLYYFKVQVRKDETFRLWTALFISEKEKLFKRHDEIHAWAELEYSSLIRMNKHGFPKEIGPLWVMVLNKQKCKLKSTKPNRLSNQPGYNFIDSQKAKLKLQISKRDHLSSDWKLCFLAQIQKLRNRHYGVWEKCFRKQRLKLQNEFEKMILSI
ncbi:hypothetical protein [Leptospira kmetyi]|uniref:DUF1564 family protein n=1 Tax=Leptospira kmetyi TaxID=408139 RepID=A0ABX4N4Z3_9LEPT|nr:hypothetical protein [Leptospira kmetyi]PJZ28376.1 hypothetical protein CH378_18025 [Leptospira kmetyi]